MLAGILIFEFFALLSAKAESRRSVDVYPATPVDSRDNLFRLTLYSVLPLLLAAGIVWPMMRFFNTFEISSQLTSFATSVLNKDALQIYLDNIVFTWEYFSTSDLLYPAIFLKVVVAGCLIIPCSARVTFPGSGRNRLKFSVFLLTVFICYVLVIAKIPNPLFTRYLVPVQPLLVLMIIVDLALVLEFFRRLPGIKGKMIGAGVMLAVLFIASAHVERNMDDMKAWFYELTHDNHGPLDYVVPFIQKNYSGRTDRLIIATNYEESALMYNLRAKVIVGFVGNNLEEDVRVKTDIIIYRNWWGNHRSVFDDYFSRDKYRKVSFPVVDHPVNNIPELQYPFPLRHQFRTMKTEDETRMTAVYLRIDHRPR